MNYQLHYDRLINRARERVLDGYKELHHIIPRCLGGGEGPQNLVYLTAEEHYVAHQLLVKLNPHHYGVSYAAMLMTMGTSQTVRSNKLYGWLKTQFSQNNSKLKKERFKDKTTHPCFGKFGEKHPRYGHPHSEEFKQMMSVKMQGRVMSKEWREKMSKSMRITFNTLEYKEKISAIRKIAFKGDKNPAYGTKMINNGVINKRILKTEPVPEGWQLGAKPYIKKGLNNASA